jgi:FMN phosphatase YigB (HAD superfamily)
MLILFDLDDTLLDQETAVQSAASLLYNTPALARLGRIGEAQSVSARLLELQPGFTVSGMLAGYAERTEHMASLGDALRELGLPE